MSRVPFQVLVSTKWLAEKLTSPPKNFRLLDASWHLPITKRNALQEYTDRHIPTAQFFDVGNSFDKSTNMEHMLPSAKTFEDFVGKLGVDNSTHVVLYDTSDFALFSAQRLWWTFKVFGHHTVSLLDGGINQWIKDGYETTKEIPKFEPAQFKAVYNPSMVKSFEDVERSLTEKTSTVIDARAKGRFDGTAPEPRAEIKPGHIPDSINIPFPTLMNLETKKIKTPDELKVVFEKAGVDFNKPVIASCGSGITACMLMLGAHLIGHDISVYDGSWVEWYHRSKKEQKIGMPE